MTKDHLTERIRLFTKSLKAMTKTAAQLDFFDPTKTYSDNTLEKYDALGARYTRTYECAIKLFRTKDLLDSNEEATTIRELFHRMEHYLWISDSAIWLSMKIVRNKLNHEYLPYDQAKIYNYILHEAKNELLYLYNKIEQSPS